MAIEFFDKLTASVSKTAKQVSDNAKTLADKNRLRKDISAMENELRNRFRDIGEQYFHENKSNPDPTYAELFDAIAELQASIAAKHQELAALDGAMTCPECGGTIIIGSKFCPGCGSPAPTPVIEPAPTTVQPLCPFCGQPLASDALFCASCGNKLPEIEQPAAEEIPAAPVDAPPTEAICPTCGEILPSDALFCAVCGTKAPGID